MRGSLSYCWCTRCHSNGDGTVTCGEPHLFPRPTSKQIIRADYKSVFFFFCNGEMMKIRNGRRRPGLPSAQASQMCHDDTSTQRSNALAGHDGCQLWLRLAEGSEACRLAQTKAATLFWGFSWQPAFLFFSKLLCPLNSLRSADFHKGIHTHNARCFGGVWGVVCKASTVACGDGVWFFVAEAHGIHRLTSIADYSLERETQCTASLQCNTRGHYNCLYENQEAYREWRTVKEWKWLGLD